MEWFVYVILKIAKILHMGPNRQPFWLTQSEFVLSHPNGEARGESHPMQCIIVFIGQAKASKPFPNRVGLLAGTAGHGLAEIDQFPLGREISTSQWKQCAYSRFGLMNLTASRP